MKRILGSSSMVAGSLAAAMLLSGCNPEDRVSREREHYTGPALDSSESVALDGAEKTRVEMRMGAGEFRVKGGAAQLMEGDFRYAVPEAKPVVRHTKNESRSVVTIEEPRGMHFNNGNGDLRWDVRLNDKQALDIIANLGAGAAKLDLSSLNLRSVEIHMGVGELNLDLRGKPQRSYDVEVQGGVGEATILVPKDVGIEAELKGGIGDISVNGLEKRGGRWVNTSQTNAPIMIRLEVSGGVGQINLRAE